MIFNEIVVSEKIGGDAVSFCSEAELPLPICGENFLWLLSLFVKGKWRNFCICLKINNNLYFLTNIINAIVSLFICLLTDFNERAEMVSHLSRVTLGDD